MRFNPSVKLKKDDVRVSSAIVGIAAGCAFIGIGVPTCRATILSPQHVVVVIEENHSYSQIIGDVTDAPYINNTLVGQGGLLYSGSYSPEHPSQPNYLDLFSGSNQGITGDYLPSAPQYTEPLANAANLGAQLLNSGHTFHEYNQSYSPIDNTSSYNQASYNAYSGISGATSAQLSDTYVRKHNAVVNWVNPNLTAVSGNLLPLSTMSGFSEFPTTASGYASLPTVSFVIPNLENDMHNGSIATGDAWLQQNLSGYLQWAKTNDSLLLVTWDENNYTLPDSNHIATIINGDPSLFVAGNSQQVFNSYSVLRTLEDMYGLGYAGNASTSPDLATNAAGQLIATPEPASLAICLIGMIAILLPVRRRSNSPRQAAKSALLS